MKRVIIVAVCILSAFISLNVIAQENQVRRIPEVNKTIPKENLALDDSNFWISAEALGAYSLRIGSHNLGLTEIDVAAGYRFNEFLKVGAGLGPRFYISQEYLRRGSARWAMPLFLTVRGNIIAQQYRQVTPWWGFEIGGCIKDGFMMRPTIGLKFGEFRHNFTLGVSYIGQNLRGYAADGANKNRFVSFICLRLGYEY